MRWARGMTRAATVAVVLMVLGGCGGGRDDGRRGESKSRPTPGLADVVKARVTVGGYPESIVAAYGALWVTNRYGGISKIDPEANRRVDRVADGAFFSRTIVAGDGALWGIDVQADTSARLQRVNPSSGAVEASLPIYYGRENPVHLLFADGYVWLLNGNDGNLYKIDPDAMAVADRVKVSPRSQVVALTEAGGSLWTSSLDAPVTQVDPRQMEIVARVGGLNALRLRGEGGTLWAAELGGGLVRVEPATARVARRVDIGHGEEFRLAIVGRTLWARSDTMLYLLDARTGAVRRSERIPRATEALGITDAFGSVWLVRGPLGQVWRLPLLLAPERGA